MSLVSDLLTVGGNYYLGTSGSDDARAAGQAAVAMAETAGQSAIDRSSFEPYTVTSNLATGRTTAGGGLDLSLSAEEQRRQNARFNQAESIYGAIGADPSRMAAEYYESIRAAQRPEEERNRLDMQQGLFSSGRGGISSGQYGGTPEQFAFEKARAEAQLGASGLKQQVCLLTKHIKDNVKLLTSSVQLTLLHSLRLQAIEQALHLRHSLKVQVLRVCYKVKN